MMSNLVLYKPSTYAGKILIVGESPTLNEAKFGIVFNSGYAREFWSQAQIAELTASECALTYVFSAPLRGGQVKNICAKKKEVTEEAKTMGWPHYPFKPLSSGKYVRPYHCLDLLRLREEILQADPNIIIALGTVPLWALTGMAGINKYRGVIQVPDKNSLGAGAGYKVIATYDPKTIFKDYAKRIIVIMDLMKALQASTTKEHVVPRRFIHIADTVEDIQWYYATHYLPGKRIWVDIETKVHQFISFIGIATDENNALVVPFLKSIYGKHFKHYWKTPEEEVEAFELINQMILNASSICGQNFIYDTQYLYRLGIRPARFCQDLMLMHHSMFIELPKSLAFFGSIFTDETAWKEEKKRGKLTEFKADD